MPAVTHETPELSENLVHLLSSYGMVRAALHR
jgi:hypothetical protein